MSDKNQYVWGMRNVMRLVKKIVEKRPVIHCITNIVTVNDCANILLAIGASPIMAHHKDEVAEITRGTSALVCNMGATEDFEAMINAGKVASSLGHPIVIDPVGVSGSTYRREKCNELIEMVQATCIRGNYNEILALIEDRNTAVGVDATLKNSDNLLAKKMEEYAKQKSVILVASGAVDIITDGYNTEYVERGNPMMAMITGTGCMSTAVQAAFLSVEKSLEASVNACSYIGMAGEIAAKKTIENDAGTMTFKNFFIDEIYRMREK